MATGASTCDLAIILVDARHGVIEQTKRHTFIASLLGIRHILVAVNKMDLVEYSQERFEEIREEFKGFAARLDLPDLHFIPISALLGGNVVDKSEHMPWYDGSTLMNFLENVYIASDRNLEDFRLPVQYVNRPHLDFRGFCGTIGSGIIRKGDEVVTLPSGKTSRVKSIVTFDGELEEAFAPLSVTLTLEDEIDASRGDMFARPGNVPRVEQHFEAMVVWMHEAPMVPGKQYLVKHSTLLTSGAINTLRYQVDVNTLHRKDAPTLALNEIGRCAISLNQPIMVDSYRRNRATGAFILIDRITNATVGAGMVMDRRSDQQHTTHWEDEPASQSLHETVSNVSEAERRARFGQTPVTILLTGLTGSGKAGVARALERRLFDEGRASLVLDGQNMRLGISRDLGFSMEDRSENLRRSAGVARVANDAGLICICAFVAPEASVREKVRHLVGEERYLEVFVSASLDYCRAHDANGLYSQADRGEIRNFPGVSAAYDVPENPHLVVETDKQSVAECVERIMALLKQRKVIL
jgi:bifunctional enzyme CysN/CysC